MMPVPASPRVMTTPRTTDTENLLEEGQQQSRRSFLSKKVVIATAVSALVMTAVAVSAGRSMMPQQASTGGIVGFAGAPKPPVAMFSEEEGKEIGAKWLENFGKGASNSDFSLIEDMCADKISFAFTGNMPPADTVSKKKMFGKKGIFAKSWGAMMSEFRATNVFTVVDTELGHAFVSFEVVILFDAHGKVKPTPTSMLSLKGNMFKLEINKDKKVTGWQAHWNPMDPVLGAAMAQIMPKPKGKAPPTPEVIISEEDGLELMNTFLDGTAACFAKDDFSPEDAIGGLFADDVEWVFSGHMTGKGSKADYFEVLKNSWGALVSKFKATVRGAAVDTVAGKIYFNFDIFLIIDGHGAVPLKDSMFFGSNFFELTVNKDKKITKWEGHWNPVDPSLESKVGAVMAKAAKK